MTWFWCGLYNLSHTQSDTPVLHHDWRTVVRQHPCPSAGKWCHPKLEISWSAVWKSDSRCSDSRNWRRLWRGKDHSEKETLETPIHFRFAVTLQIRFVKHRASSNPLLAWGWLDNVLMFIYGWTCALKDGLNKMEHNNKGVKSNVWSSYVHQCMLN